MTNDLKYFIKQTAEETAKQVVEKLNTSPLHNNADPDELIYQDAARKMLGGVSSVTLTRWDRSGYLPKHHIGRKVCYRRGDIDAIIKKGGRQ